MNEFGYLLSGSDLCAVTETVVVVLYLIAILISIAISYGCYLLTANFLSFVLAAESGTKTIDRITMAIGFGNFHPYISYGFAVSCLSSRSNYCKPPSCTVNALCALEVLVAFWRSSSPMPLLLLSNKITYQAK